MTESPQPETTIRRTLMKLNPTLLTVLGSFALAGATAHGAITLAQYNFGQAGATTAPSGDFAAVTAGDATAWGLFTSFNVDSSPSRYATEPVAAITRNTTSNDLLYGFYIDITVPAGTTVDFDTIEFNAAPGGTSGNRGMAFGYQIDPTGAPTEPVTNLQTEVRYDDGDFPAQTFDVLWSYDLSAISAFAGVEDTVVRFVWSVGSGNDYSVEFDNITITAVPEPATYAVLAGIGALGLVLLRRRLRE
jgi:hypothetical protein